VLSYLSFLLFLLTNPQANLSAPLEKETQRIIGDQPALLKTTNGCWDVSHIVINRGDSSQNIKSSIGYFAHTPFTYNDTIIIADYLPAKIVDASFADVPFQDFIGNNDERYFTVTTPEFIYLYYTIPILYESAIIVRYDSIPTPDGYIKSIYNGETQLLVLSKEDSVSYAYTFYSIPTLDFINQISLTLRPDFIKLSGSLWYLIVGDSAGTQKMITINQTNQQLNYNVNLPADAEHTRAVSASNGYYFLVSTPGDTSTNIVQFNTSDTLFNTIHLFPHSGLNGVVPYSDFSTEFFLQPSIDTSSSQLNKQILEIDAVLGLISDSFFVNKTITSLHKNTAFGWGPYVYSIIFGVDSPKNVVYYFPPWPLGIVDSAKCNSSASWFGEDFRCYVTTQQVEQNLSIEVSPNPVTDEVLIQVNHLAKGKTYNFEITSLDGKILWRKDILTQQEYSVPLQDLPKGILILKVDAGTKVVTKKIVKQ
jgi:hypothetical protein